MPEHYYYYYYYYYIESNIDLVLLAMDTEFIGSKAGAPKDSLKFKLFT
jgi:hypothetical protein